MPNTSRCRLRLILIVSTCFIFLLQCNLPLAFAQDPPSGIVPFSTQIGGLYNSIDLATGSMTFEIPIRSKTGKIPFSLKLVGNVSVAGRSDTPPRFNVVSNFFPHPFGANLGVSVLLKYLQQMVCNQQHGDNLYSVLGVVDNTGTLHSLPNVEVDQLGCVHPTASTIDGSGYTVVFQSATSYTIYDRAGDAGTWSSATDPDGIAISGILGVGNSYIDSLGSKLLTVNGSINGTGPMQFQYNDAAGNTQTFQVNYTPYTQATNFGCSGVTDEPPQLVNLVSSITLEDNSSINISYEPTPGSCTPISGTQACVTGRLSEMTLPEGGYDAYTYTGGSNGINCNSEVVPTLTRTISDNNGNVDTWTYVNSNNGSIYSPQNFVVTATDPANNQTVYTFSGELQTQAAYYQGVATGTPLKLVTTCYNTNFANCATWLPPAYGTFQVTQKDVYTSFNGSASNLVETKFDFSGNTTEVKQYDFGAAMPPSSSPISDTVISYGRTWNGSTSSPACSQYPSGTYIVNTPCYSHTMNSSGADVARTQIAYSNTGHPVSTGKWTGSSWLTSTATYNTNGTVATVTDANGATVYTYAYNGTGGCASPLLPLLPTSVTITGPGLPSGGLTTSTQWDCNGAVNTSTMDPNSASTSTYYTQNGVADPFYRPLSTVDPLGYTTGFTYSPVTFEGAMNFNGTVSATDSLVTTDGLGRQIVTQLRQGQGAPNWDSTQTGYGWTSASGACSNLPPFTTGSCTTRSQPYSGARGSPAPNGTAVVTTQYDAIGRPLSVADGGGGTTSYVYNQKDVLVTVSPAPTGENVKKRQLEYDGLGRLTSVCEITAGTTTWPGGNCAQSNPQTGYWTKYTYDAQNNLQTVTQNAQASSLQQRTYLYDALSRLVSESNPETSNNGANGTISYTYDSDTICGSSSNGDLVKTVDAANNVSCYAYASHRLTGITYPSGPNSGSTPSKTFLYDATTFSCTNSNAFVKGRLAEAYTTSSTGSKLTDIAYCYSPRGEIWDAFESTPNSGSTPYHTVASYWANGPLNTLKGVPQHNTWTFGVDGEGRPNSALDGTTTLVTATQNMYNAASQPLVVNLGSGDSDIYTYDPNTGRMATYQYKVGSTPAYVTGTLGWSSNWTLGSLVIADGFEKANAQQCGYTYDDMSRLGSVSCGPTSPNGTTWGQAFSYDPFGNITKTVPHSMTGISWQPGYNTNNQYTLGGANYDGNGNLLADTFNTYAWDSDTNVVGINLNGSTPISITYDALDRAVEESNSGTYKQILYGPTGGKLALMSGQTATNVFLPLPGGEQATYTNSTIRFRHYDWLGSARFESSMAQKEYGDVAYAPFGEPYSILGTPYLSFTGQQQDSISGTYDFLFREYNPVQGRWISPDPSGLSAVDPNNPQSWNRYAYVLNNPLSATDPFGLWCVWEDGTHDSPFRDGGVSRDDCADQGGHWDPTDTIAGIWQDGFGNVTKVNYIDGTTCTTGNCAGGTQTLEELDQWLQGLQSLGTVNVNGGSAPQVDLENSGTVPVATISAGPPDAKKNYCLHQSNMAGVEAVLPGSQILWGTDYSPAAVGELAGHAAAEYGLDAAASSGGFLYSLRSLTGVPMTQAAKWLGRGSIAIWGYQVYQAHKASHRAYKVCMD